MPLFTRRSGTFVAVASVVLIAGILHLRGTTHPTENNGVVVFPSASPLPPQATPPEENAKPSARLSSSNLLKAFQDKMGTEFEVESLSDGRVASLRSKGKGKPALTDFDIKDSAKTLLRAREILKDAKALLGLKDSLPLNEGKSITNVDSARVSFHENSGGIPVAPGGGVSVDLGSDGELLSLYSSYEPAATASNPESFSANEGRLKATAAVHDSDATASSRIEGGSQVVWVSKSGESPEGRRAYEYTSGGRQVIIDATTGAVLSIRDQRRN